MEIPAELANGTSVEHPVWNLYIVYWHAFLCGCESGAIDYLGEEPDSPPLESDIASFDVYESVT